MRARGERSAVVVRRAAPAAEARAAVVEERGARVIARRLQVLYLADATCGATGGQAARHVRALGKQPQVDVELLEYVRIGRRPRRPRHDGGARGAGRLAGAWTAGRT